MDYRTAVVGKSLARVEAQDAEEVDCGAEQQRYGLHAKAGCNDGSTAVSLYGVKSASQAAKPVY